MLPAGAKKVKVSDSARAGPASHAKPKKQLQKENARINIFSLPLSICKDEPLALLLQCLNALSGHLTGTLS